MALWGAYFPSIAMVFNSSTLKNVKMGHVYEIMGFSLAVDRIS
jgi:hypothetical protein